MDLTSILRGDFSSWHGLPAGVRLDDALRALQPVETVAPPYVAGRIARARVTSVRRLRPPSRIDVWCAWDRDEVTTLESSEPPENTNLVKTLDALGNAEMIARDRKLIEAGRIAEHVYAWRGLTLDVVEPFDDRAPFLTGFSLYAPADAGTYLAEIGSGPTPMPEPIGG
jgi:hypothetical protein